MRTNPISDVLEFLTQDGWNRIGVSRAPVVESLDVLPVLFQILDRWSLIIPGIKQDEHRELVAV
jgi:hypothetical protein